jgi:hypothetical protein
MTTQDSKTQIWKPLDEKTASRLLTLSSSKPQSPVDHLLNRLTSGERMAWIESLEDVELGEIGMIPATEIIRGAVSRSRLQSLRDSVLHALSDARTIEEARHLAWAHLLTVAALAADHRVIPDASPRSRARLRDTFMELSELLDQGYSRLFSAAAACLPQSRDPS